MHLSDRNPFMACVDYPSRVIEANTLDCDKPLDC